MWGQISSGSSGWRGGGQETWNHCGRLLRPSFLWLIFTGGMTAWHPCPPPPPAAPPAGSATANWTSENCNFEILWWVFQVFWFTWGEIDGRRDLKVIIFTACKWSLGQGIDPTVFTHVCLFLSRNCPFERINSLQCYELTRRWCPLLFI